MNENYRAALIQGVLASAHTFGLPDQFQVLYEDGMKCLQKRGRKETVYQISIDFTRYLDSHPDQTKGAFPLIFLLFMSDCPRIDL